MDENTSANGPDEAQRVAQEAHELSMHPRVKIPQILAGLQGHVDMHDRMNALSRAVQDLAGLFLHHSPPLPGEKEEPADVEETTGDG